ncbi:MAG: hypothetical protein WCD53_01310 [Microcoleus sp.]
MVEFHIDRDGRWAIALFVVWGKGRSSFRKKQQLRYTQGMAL